MVKIKIISFEKRDLYWMSSILFLLVIIGVIAYTLPGQTANPQVMGHSADEVLPDCANGNYLKKIGGIWTCRGITDDVYFRQGSASNNEKITIPSQYDHNGCSIIFSPKSGQTNLNWVIDNSGTPPVHGYKVSFDGGGSCSYLLICKTI
jgi:hypothetical protein